MHSAAQGLVGEHDFAAYCRPREGATTTRTLRSLDVTRDSDGVVVIAAHADAFCHNQVRAMVGALLAVGDGRKPPGWPAEVLRGGVRDSSVNVAPPHGLTLVAVDYPPDDELTTQPNSPPPSRRALIVPYRRETRTTATSLCPSTRRTGLKTGKAHRKPPRTATTCTSARTPSRTPTRASDSSQDP